ncbi:hypothetical protein IL306_001952 [Fusarium sp. DS 682]|nr:hypothetical protein IL306_001952 [Fusarium sp. DS 682]
MAILPQVPGLEVVLCMNNERIKEYDRSPETLESDIFGSTNQIPSHHCYIASEADSPYFIECIISGPLNFPKDADVLIFDVWIDGQLFVTEILRQRNLNHSGEHVVKLDSRPCKIGRQSYFQSLKFEDLLPDEEADFELMDRDPKRSQSIGQIIVKVWYGKQDAMSYNDKLNEPLRPLDKTLFKNVIINNEDVTHGT